MCKTINLLNSLHYMCWIIVMKKWRPIRSALPPATSLVRLSVGGPSIHKLRRPRAWNFTYFFLIIWIFRCLYICSGITSAKYHALLNTSILHQIYIRLELQRWALRASCLGRFILATSSFIGKWLCTSKLWIISFRLYISILFEAQFWTLRLETSRILSWLSVSSALAHGVLKW